VGATLPSAAITSLTLAQFLQIIQQQTPILQAALTPANKNDLTVRPIDISKVGAQLVPHDYPVQRSYHNFAWCSAPIASRHGSLSADFVRRVFVNELYDGTNIDLNKYNRTINGVQSPVIPVCPTGRRTPLAWSAPMAQFRSGCRGARQTYTALLMKLDKRFSKRYQLLLLMRCRPERVSTE